jgi:hypothetical protein
MDMLQQYNFLQLAGRSNMSSRKAVQPSSNATVSGSHLPHYFQTGGLIKDKFHQAYSISVH